MVTLEIGSYPVTLPISHNFAPPPDPKENINLMLVLNLGRFYLAAYYRDSVIKTMFLNVAPNSKKEGPKTIVISCNPMLDRNSRLERR